MSNIEVSRETRYNYFTNIESETTFKNNLSTEYNNTTISAVLKVNNFAKRKYHYSLENLEIKSSLLNSNEEQGCIKSLEEGFTVEKRMANLLDKLAYPAISSEHCINLMKLIYSEIQLSLPNESVTSWQSFEYGFGAPILARYNSYFGGKDKIIIEKTRKYFLEGSETDPIEMSINHHYTISDPEAVVFVIDTEKKLIESINGDLRNTFINSEVKSDVGSRFHLSYISHSGAKQFKQPEAQVEREDKESIQYSNIAERELSTIWKSMKVDNARSKLDLFNILNKLLENKNIHPSYLVELIKSQNFTKSDASNRSTVVAGVFAANGSVQIEKALIEMLEVADYHTKLQAVMAIADTNYNTIASIEALESLLNNGDELSDLALLSLAQISSRLNSKEVVEINRKAIEDCIVTACDEKLVLDAIGNSGDIYFLPVIQEYLNSYDPSSRKAAFLQLRKMNIGLISPLVQKMILEETEHSVRESILELISSLPSTSTAFDLAIYYYNHEQSESLRSEALIAITAHGSCCMKNLDKKLIDISKTDPSTIIQHIAESYHKGIFE